MDFKITIRYQTCSMKDREGAKQRWIMSWLASFKQQDSPLVEIFIVIQLGIRYVPLAISIYLNSRKNKLFDRKNKAGCGSEKKCIFSTKNQWNWFVLDTFVCFFAASTNSALRWRCKKWYSYSDIEMEYWNIHIYIYVVVIVLMQPPLIGD